MDQADLDGLIQLGQLVVTDKHYLTGMHFLWIYDYFLTLGDEVTYAWHGMRSWIFALFLCIRYTPILYLMWVNYADFFRSDCNATKWVGEWETVNVSFLAQIAVTIRIYAITGRNKWLAGLLSVMLLTQLGLGINVIYQNAKNEAIPFPSINLDPFIFCLGEALRADGDAYTFLGVGFDLVAFAIIFFKARRVPQRYPGIPSILDTILRGATIYFVIIFTAQLLLVFFLFLAPPKLILFPGLIVTALTPILASRLMLSLKKASVEPTGPWSLQSVSSLSGPMEDESIRLPQRAIGVSFRVPEASNQSADEGDVELESLPKRRIREDH